LVTMRVECPVCKKQKKIEIDPTSAKGIVCYLAPADKVCEHILLVFVDEKGNIHRVQRLDHIGVDTGVGIPRARGMSLRGAMKVFGPVFTDMISAVLLGKTLVLCDDVDVAITVYNTLARLFTTSVSLGKNVLIIEDCTQAPDDAYVVNCRYAIGRGDVDTSAHKSLGRYLREAIAVNDNEAAVMFVRQRLSGLQRAADVVSEKVESRINAKDLIAMIEQETGITFRYDDIHAILALLRSRGQTERADLVQMGDLNGF